MFNLLPPCSVLYAGFRELLDWHFWQLCRLVASSSHRLLWDDWRCVCL